MPASHATLELDQLNVCFDDTHAVANAGLLPATLADRLGIAQAADELVRVGGPRGRPAWAARPACTLAPSC